MMSKAEFTRYRDKGINRMQFLGSILLILLIITPFSVCDFTPITTAEQCVTCMNGENEKQVCKPSVDYANAYCCDPTDETYECSPHSEGICSNEFDVAWTDPAFLLCPVPEDQCTLPEFQVSGLVEVQVDQMQPNSFCNYQLTVDPKYRGIRVKLLESENLHFGVFTYSRKEGFIKIDSVDIFDDELEVDVKEGQTVHVLITRLEDDPAAMFKMNFNYIKNNGSKGLSTPKIIAIVFGSLTACILIASIAYFCYRRKTAKTFGRVPFTDEKEDHVDRRINETNSSMSNISASKQASESLLT